jgi:hypothetical protein
MKQKLINYFSALFPAIAIETSEETRVIAEIIEAAKECKKGIVTWSATDGMSQVIPQVKKIPDTDDLFPACKKQLEDSIYIFRDVQTWPFDRDPLLARAMRDLIAWAPTAGSCIVLVGNSFKGHETFEKLVTVLDYSLPSPGDLKNIATGIAESAGKELKIGDDVIRALGGLSTTEAENALALSVVETKGFDSEIIYREKVQAVKKSGLLEIVDPDPRGLEAIGGLEELKDWIVKRKRAYTPEAAAFGLPSPKGVLLVGVPGTGKSLSAKQ